jgi:hypothetical protein
MVVADGQVIPLACPTASASPAEVTLAESTLEQAPRPEGETIPLIAHQAYDSDPLREHLAKQGWDLVGPHPKRRMRQATQDSRKLRRYRHRWTIDRTISWLGTSAASLSAMNTTVTSIKPSSISPVH